MISNFNLPDQKVEEFKFEVNQIFAIDVIVSANPEEGKSKESVLRTTIFKKKANANFELKTKSGKQFMSTVNKQFHDMAFSLNDFEHIMNARIGLSEALKAKVLDPFKVLEEKTKAPVA